MLRRAGTPTGTSLERPVRARPLEERRSFHGMRRMNERGELEVFAEVGGRRLGAHVEPGAAGDLEGGAGRVGGPLAAAVGLDRQLAADDRHPLESLGAE